LGSANANTHEAIDFSQCLLCLTYTLTLHSASLRAQGVFLLSIPSKIFMRVRKVDDEFMFSSTSSCIARGEMNFQRAYYSFEYIKYEIAYKITLQKYEKTGSEANILSDETGQVTRLGLYSECSRFKPRSGNDDADWGLRDFIQ